MAEDKFLTYGHFNLEKLFTIYEQTCTTIVGYKTGTIKYRIACANKRFKNSAGAFVIVNSDNCVLSTGATDSLGDYFNSNIINTPQLFSCSSEFMSDLKLQQAAKTDSRPFDVYCLVTENLSDATDALREINVAIGII